MNTYITNDSFREGCRCRRLFWLNMKNDSTYTAALPQLSALAREYISGGAVACGDDCRQRADSTLQLIKNGERLIKSPVFITENTCVEADIFCIKNGIPHIYFSYPAMHLRRVFSREAGLIYAAAEHSGIKAPKIIMLLLRKEYERKGEIDPRQLFAEYDLTSDAAAFKEKSYVLSQILYETAKSDEEPEEPIQKGCLNPEACKYFDHCTSHLPHPNIFKVSRLNINTKLQLYKEGRVSYSDLRNESRLTENQRKQIRMSMDNVAPVVKKKELREFFETLWYPMCFLDFESWQPPVPPSDGMHPFSQIPFQYSLHIVRGEGETAEHREFLAEGEADPREALAKRLVEDIPCGACVVVYNKQFESMVIGSLAEKYPELRERLFEMRGNIRDLMMPFQKRYYYDPKMEGSFSIKAVLPAMYPSDPELSYDNLGEIHNGSQAMLSYASLSGETPENVARIRKCLLQYCRLDTLGMVKIVEKLKSALG